MFHLHTFVLGCVTLLQGACSIHMVVVALEACSQARVSVQRSKCTGTVIGRAGLKRIESEDSTLSHWEVLC
ncbi:hypothetical protein BGP81_13490 [Pseudomonas putida]|nr:hypothetical protein BGP81_13490 [Pseudomonas putida]